MNTSNPYNYLLRRILIFKLYRCRNWCIKEIRNLTKGLWWTSPVFLSTLVPNHFQYKMNEYSTKEQNSVSSCVETSVWSSAEKILGSYNYWNTRLVISKEPLPEQPLNPLAGLVKQLIWWNLSVYSSTWPIRESQVHTVLGNVQIPLHPFFLQKGIWGCYFKNIIFKM